VVHVVYQHVVHVYSRAIEWPRSLREIVSESHERAACRVAWPQHSERLSPHTHGIPLYSSRARDDSVSASLRDARAKSTSQFADMLWLTT
jgi:hypothetical protein